MTLVLTGRKRPRHHPTKPSFSGVCYRMGPRAMGTLSSADKRTRGRAGVALRQHRMARTNWLCERCLAEGVTRLAKVVNHKLPLAHGGEDTDDNTENLCAEHDAEETAKWFNRNPKVATGIDGWPIE